MTSTRKWDAHSRSKSQERHIAKVQTACVQDNKALALSVNRKDVDRCVKVIRQYGLLTPPVIGKLDSGEQVLLSGECEFQALLYTVPTGRIARQIRELGQQADRSGNPP